MRRSPPRTTSRAGRCPTYPTIPHTRTSLTRDIQRVDGVRKPALTCADVSRVVRTNAPRAGVITRPAGAGHLERPNVALVAFNAPKATLGALSAPNATLGRLGPGRGGGRATAGCAQ